MKICFDIPAPETCVLGNCALGSIVYLLDSERGAQSRVEAMANPGEELFLVHNSIKPEKGHVDLVSLDGAHTFRRQDDRQIAVIGLEHVLAKNSGVIKAVGSFAGNSCVVIHNNDRTQMFDIDAFATAKMKKVQKKLLKYLWIVVKEAPAPAGKVALVSFAGEKIFVDDDRKFHLCDIEILLHH